MISQIISVIDRLIQLKEYRDKRAQYIFEKLLEPMFNDLLVVHADYISMLETLQNHLLAVSKKDITDYAKVISELHGWLKQRATEYEPHRQKLKSIIGKIDSVSENPLVDKFIYTVIDYFPDGRLSKRTSKWRTIWRGAFYIRSSHYTTLMRRFQQIHLRIEKGDILSDSEAKDFIRLWSKNKHSLEKDIAYTLKLCREKWSLMCEAFAVLKLSLVS